MRKCLPFKERNGLGITQLASGLLLMINMRVTVALVVVVCLAPLNALADSVPIFSVTGQNDTIPVGGNNSTPAETPLEGLKIAIR